MENTGISDEDEEEFLDSAMRNPWALEGWESISYWAPVNRLRYSFSMATTSKNDWKQLNPPKFAIALYTYNASGRFEVPLEIGEKLKLEEESNGWYRGTSLSSSTAKKGIFPANYVKYADTIQELEMDTDVIIMEIQKTFRSWQNELQKTLDEENMQRFAQVRQLIIELVSLRQKIFTKLDNNLKQQIRKKIEEGAKAISAPPTKAAVQTMRNHSLTATKHEIQASADEGIISLYLRHVDQRNKQSEQLRENKRLSVAVTSSPQPQAKSSPMMAKAVSSRSLTNTPTPTPQIRRNMATRIPSKIGDSQEPSKYYQILLDMKVFMCSTGESSEIRFSLYNADHKKFITEDYQITLTAHGMPEDVSKIGKIKTVFKDITDTDTSGEVYLVARLFRKGRILPEMKGKTKKNIDYRRPFGCAVMKLSKVSAKADEGSIFGDHGNEKEHTLPIYSTENENDIVLLPDLIPKNQNLIQVPHAKGIVVGLTLYHGEFENINEIRDIAVVNKMEFPEVIMPGLQRHDFYVTLESGEFTKTDNIEVGVTIRTDDGTTINDCLIVAAGPPLHTEFRSSIISKDPNPIWRESINVKIPETQFAKTHLYFTFRLCSDTTSKDKDFAFAFLPLTTADGPVVSDSEHVLPLYSLPKSNEEPTFYLKQDQSAKLVKLVRKGEQIKVKTLLSSTKLTTDGAMLYLLHWKEMPKQKLPDILNRVTYIHTVEILKFLRELFDSMFAILDSNGMDSIGLLVYNAIVFIIGILLDEKRNQNAGIDLRRILDSYISEHFTGATAHKHLMSCLKQCLDGIGEKPQISKINATFKALEYIFKFIIKSRLLYTAQGALKTTSEDVWFKKDILEVFQVFNALMKKSGAEFRGVQANALKNFGYIIPDLGQIFGNKELANIIKDFVGSMSQYDASLKLLNMEKLHVIQTLVTGEFFLETESRAILLPIIISQLDLHMKSSIEEERRECILIINEMIRLYETKLKESTLLLDLLPLVPQIMKAVPTFKGNGAGRLDVVTCFLTMFHVMKPEHFDGLLNLVKDDNWTFVMKVFQNFQSFILVATYPDSWLPMNMFQYNIILKVVTELTKYAIKQYSSAQNKDQFFGAEEDNPADKFKQVSKLDVWRQFFKLAAMYIQAKTLAGIRWGSEAKQKEINEKCDKLRLGMMRVLRNMWQPIGTHKVKFIHNLITPLLEFQAINNQEIQKIASELYHNAIEAEWEDKVAPNSFPKVETLTIDALDKLSNKDAGGVSEEFRNFFLSNLEARLKTNAQDLQQKGLKFVNDIKYFLGLLTALRTLPDGPEYDDDRTVANLKLMEYFKQTNRREAYVRYVHKLALTHERNQNYVEAGEALLLHARLYKWNTERQGEISGDNTVLFPAQTQRERKETLYRHAIDQFDKGKMWERACSLIKELREEYQYSTYEYEKLGDLLELQATLLKKILTETRFFAEYYRVAFYGKGFDKNVSGKDFIYRGLELEKRDDFIARMKFLFPNAEILPRPDDPTPDIINGAGQYLQIMPVRPTSREEMEGQVNKRIHPNMPPVLQKYYLVNDVNVFVFSKPFRKTKEKSDNEFKDLWVLNKYYITEDSFPTIHRRSQITNTVSLEVSPVDTAYRTMKEKNLELQELLIKHNPQKNKTVPAIQEFTMVIKGVIDALVNGGPDKYKDAFFNAQYAQQNPDKKQVVQNLKEELLKQISILESALALHKTRIGAEMADLQQLFEEKFLQMKEKSKTIN